MIINSSLFSLNCWHFKHLRVFIIVPACVTLLDFCESEACIHIHAQSASSTSSNEVVVIFVWDYFVARVEINASEEDSPKCFITLELNNPIISGPVLWQLAVDHRVWELNLLNYILLANEESRGVSDVESKRHCVPFAKASDREGVIDLVQIMVDRFISDNAVWIQTSRILGVVMEGQLVEFTGHLVDVEVFLASVWLEFPVSRALGEVECGWDADSEEREEDDRLHS